MPLLIFYSHKMTDSDQKASKLSSRSKSPQSYTYVNVYFIIFNRQIRIKQS
jgi:hypothetical protein